MSKDIEFNFKANYPLPENEAEWHKRAASAIARVLISTYPPEVIDGVIRLYKEKCQKEK